MAIKRQMCVNHGERPAIGVCVITRRAICAECSTRYEGVNYSKEGLAILQQRRAAEAHRGAGTLTTSNVLATLGWPVCLLLLFYAYRLGCHLLIYLQQLEFTE